MLADMHTHSENSHDSTCAIEDMLRAQLAVGTEIFAVTDHFDADSHTDYDVFTPIQKSCKTAAELNEKYKDRCRVLAGVEIGEGFWHPEICKRAMQLADYDVIIGSVHVVKHKILTDAYSRIDFSKADGELICGYLDAYFDDVLAMLDFLDFDILAHLTCPLRYINGKFHAGVGLERYGEKIEKILKNIIARDIALEVNTSSFDLLGDFMPTRSILERYFAMGGRRITLGSDAHAAKNASAHFEKAICTLKDTGFERICAYENRKPFFLEI